LGRPIAAVYSGDGNFRGSNSAALPWLANAANRSGGFAADAMASAFGVLGLSGDAAGSVPLGTSLEGVSLKMTDSAGAGRMAPLYGVFGSAGQVNFVVPAGTAAGMAGVTLTLPDGGTVATAVNVAAIAPGIFTANMTGDGVFAGQVVHVLADGTQTIGNSAVWDGGQQKYVEAPIDLGAPGDRVFLVLYGTGLSHAGSVTAAAGGVTLPMLYAGPQGQYPGLDQVNVQIPASMAGAGLVSLTITADGRTANAVTVKIR
jgi:uncharacterized protein (TIGR03437 family)